MVRQVYFLLTLGQFALGSPAFQPEAHLHVFQAWGTVGFYSGSIEGTRKCSQAPCPWRHPPSSKPLPNISSRCVPRAKKMSTSGNPKAGSQAASRSCSATFAC